MGWGGGGRRGGGVQCSSYVLVFYTLVSCDQAIGSDLRTVVKDGSCGVFYVRRKLQQQITSCDLSQCLHRP